MRPPVFGIRKFKALLLSGSFTVLASYIVRLSDSIIAGHMLGENALAGINLVGPVLSAISFLAGLIATGMATHYSLEMGRCAPDRARQFFMQGLWSVLMLGGGLALLCLSGREWFLDFYAASPEITDYARAYLAWVWPVAVLEGLEMLLVSLGYADGDVRVCSLGYVVIFLGNFVASVVGVHVCRQCDPASATMGCAIGSVIAKTLGCMVLASHWFRKTNSFKPVWHFSLRDTWRIAMASFGDAAAFLCDGLLFLFLNKFAIMFFGSEVLPVVGVATVIWGLLEFFNGIGVAIQPIVTVYYGEGNTRSARMVMNSAMRVAVVEGLALVLVFGCFPEQVAKAVGVSDPTVVAQCASAIQHMSVGFVALALAGLFNSYYMFIEKPALAAVVTFLCYLIMPIAGVAIGSLAGLSGMWSGLGWGPTMGVLTAAVIIISVAGWRMFPLLLNRERDQKLHVFNLRLTEAEIVDTSRKIAALPGVPMRAALMAEEVFMVVRDRARGRKLLGEATVDLNDGVRLTLRDDGEIFDVTDADAQISSLRTFLVASMMYRQDGRLNLVTTGFNRNVFEF